MLEVTGPGSRGHVSEEQIRAGLAQALLNTGMVGDLPNFRERGANDQTLKDICGRDPDSLEQVDLVQEIEAELKLGYQLGSRLHSALGKPDSPKTVRAIVSALQVVINGATAPGESS